MITKEIEEIRDKFVEDLSPERIYLFGSYAEDTFRDDSDFDFYIIVSDDSSDLVGITANAHRSIRWIKKRPVDIIVGRSSKFEERKNAHTVESEVYRKGILLYGRSESLA